MRVSIVATDTGAGKTFVACALVRSLRDVGLDVAVSKPVESGTLVDGVDLGPADALALREASGGRDTVGIICPWPLPNPVAPAAEFERLGLQVTLDDVVRAVDRAWDDADLVIVETAGGLRSPMLPAASPLRLAQALGGITILVVPDRLGAISQAVLALEALEAAEVPAFATVLSRRTAENAAALGNAEWIARTGPPTPLYVVESDGAVPEELVERLRALVRVPGAG
jgi:dethiobiotin synthetase